MNRRQLLKSVSVASLAPVSGWMTIDETPARPLEEVWKEMSTVIGANRTITFPPPPLGTELSVGVVRHGHPAFVMPDIGAVKPGELVEVMFDGQRWRVKRRRIL